MTQLRIALAAAMAALAVVPAPALADFVLDGRVYPEHRRSELMNACHGLEAKSRQSLTAVEKLDIPSSDPASDYYLARVTFNLRDCREAGLL